MKYTGRLKRFGLYTDNAYPYTSLEQVKAITGAAMHVYAALAFTA